MMLSWTIGDVKVTRVVEFEFQVDYDPEGAFLREASPAALAEIPWLKPHFLSDQDQLLMSIHALLVETPTMKLIVDTCFGNDKPNALLQHAALSTGFLNALAEAGAPRESIDRVVCTHLHVDHVGWNTMLVDGKWQPTFPNARYLFGAEEHAHWSTDESAENLKIMAESVQPVFEAGLVDLVAMDERICPEIRLMPTAGHTPGHVSVVIESSGETAIITGDMMHHPCQIARPEWSPGFDSDKAAARVTRAAFLGDVADAPILIIGTHFSAPTAGHIEREGDSFRFSV
jgi:glyoxylase-like metal-dependent hydrolase (beta-lactamase superfamily II)